MIEGFDIEIGRFFDALDDAVLAEDTLVIFTSDNGSLYSNAPLRSIKGHLYEGGIRVPMMARWPGVIEAGTVNDTPVISTDYVPTVMELAGLAPISDHPVDGESLVPLFKQIESLDRDAIYFHYPNYAFHHQNRLGSAIRQGDYKLIKWYDDGSVELYNLAKDVGEKANLAAQKPKIATYLKTKLEARLDQVGAQYPTAVGARE